jgi:DnaJ-class molecular chaperone
MSEHPFTRLLDEPHRRNTGAAVSPEVILPCPSCNGKYNGHQNHSHTDSRNGPLDDRFLACRLCHGHGAITCETCEGNGRVRMLDGKIVGTHHLGRTASLEQLAAFEKAKKG